MWPKVKAKSVMTDRTQIGYRKDYIFTKIQLYILLVAKTPQIRISRT